MKFLSLLSFGFLLGLRHSTDPDHVVAVSTLVARNRDKGTAWVLGAFWGLGHMLTVLSAGAVIIAFKARSQAGAERVLESAVGIMLTGLGLLNMAGYRLSSLGVKTHSHPHDHEDPEHSHQFMEISSPGPHPERHSHLHEPGWLKAWAGAGKNAAWRSALVGLMHGLAGSAAVALLALAAIASPTWAFLYLVVFSLGTLIGMLLLSALMELSLFHLARWWNAAQTSLCFATGLLSFLLGLYTLYRNAR
ncbi:MAG: hypothetical protein HY921_06715 [Elusimicrobia bacterium]|nr:hypothetical protein [Elusimicrobiota bacterium]